MRAVLCRRPGPGREAVFEDVEIPAPAAPRGRDLLVRVRAISINPLDLKRRGARPDAEDPGVILGWDAAGVVEAVGEAVEGFAAGDQVFYAGAIGRSGCQAEKQLVDERIVARKPANLSFAEAAALPLTAITASEALFDHLALGRDSRGALLVLGGAGGVASMAIQLARRLSEVTVIGAGAREESRAWILAQGAHHAVDRLQPLRPQLARLGHDQVRFVVSTHTSEACWREIAEVVAPFGHVCLVDHPPQLDFAGVKPKSVAIHWQSMFSRTSFQTQDVDVQGRYLRRVSELVDAGLLRSTATTALRPIEASTVDQAHALQASGQVIGKVVLDGF